MIAVAVTAVACLIAFDTRLSISKYTVKSDKISEPVSFVLVTDLHSCKYGDNQSELIDAIDKVSPDMVLLAGDIADDVMSNENTYIFISAIASKYRCYYVTGNHEIWSGEPDYIKSVIREYGVTVLEGENVLFTKGCVNINICGVDDPDSGGVPFDQQLENAFDGTNAGNYTILLSHRPELLDKYSKYNCDMVVSGHAHGGQARIPFTDISLVAPNQGWLPVYTSGIYEMDGTVMVVSRGLARESTRLPRIFNRPEIVYVEIVPSG